MSEQQYTTPEKPAGYRSYPENLRYYADHFDKYRMWADSGMTRAMRQSAEDVETLRARVTELEARIAEAEKQEPVAWRKGKYLRTNETMADTPEEHDGLTRCGWWPLYAAPVPAQPAVPDEVARDAERYRWLRRKVCIIGTEHLSETKAIFDFVNLPYPTFIAPCAAAELDASIDAAMLAAKAKENK